MGRWNDWSEVVYMYIRNFNIGVYVVLMNQESGFNQIWLIDCNEFMKQNSNYPWNLKKFHSRSMTSIGSSNAIFLVLSETTVPILPNCLYKE